MATEDEIKSVRDRGDAFVMWSVVLLLVVHLLIFPALVKDKKTVNQLIGNQVRRLDDQRTLLEQDLKRIVREIDFIKKVQQQNGPALKDIPLPLVSDVGRSVPENLPSLNRARQDLLLALETNAEKSVLLAKSKYSRELKIPGTDTAVDESQIRLFYPTALAAWFLVLVIRFRNPLCRLLAAAGDGGRPLWCAPVPYGKGGFWPITSRNLVWCCAIGLLARLFLNSSRRGEFFASSSVFILNLVAAALATITCAVLLVMVVRESFQCLRTSGTN